MGHAGLGCPAGQHRQHHFQQDARSKKSLQGHGSGSNVHALQRRTIHAIVKAVFRESAARLRQRGPEFEAAAAHLEQASTHWMRHTVGSHLSEKTDLKVVRDNLGHANISTTSIYLHSEDDARHDATSAGHSVGWRTS